MVYVLRGQRQLCLNVLLKLVYVNMAAIWHGLQRYDQNTNDAKTVRSFRLF